MKIHVIKFGNQLEILEDVYLEDSDHAIRYAAEIFKDDRLCSDLVLQRKSFANLFIWLKLQPNRDLDKLSFTAFQIQFARESLEEITILRKKANLSTEF